MTRFLLYEPRPDQLGPAGRRHRPQYRSVIFYADERQRTLAERAKERAQRLFTSPIVTQIEPLSEFYEAEPIHQNYYALNPSQGYCTFMVSPKVAKARQAFAHLLR